MTNGSATLRLGLAALLAVAGLGLIVYGAIDPQATAAMETGKWLLLGSPLTAWGENPVPMLPFVPAFAPVPTPAAPAPSVPPSPLPAAVQATPEVPPLP